MQRYQVRSYVEEVFLVINLEATGEVATYSLPVSPAEFALQTYDRALKCQFDVIKFIIFSCSIHHVRVFHELPNSNIAK
jgi:hypothetical protein